MVLDSLIIELDLSEKGLFAGAELRETTDLSIKTLLIQGVFNPVITMIFITGYALNILIKKTELAIPVNGILYSFMNFNLGIGYLGFGMIAAGLTRFTGSLIPAILFSVGCAIAKFLILTSYPRIISILVFLM
ncbi:MAG: CPBP family glutamic-type intramembrane protease [Nitrospinota bacterium]|nr:CPBP family glutamic-type intramembrane protease [Nitrospinota bacterium]